MRFSTAFSMSMLVSLALAPVAFAGTPAPELDPSSFGSGLGLAGAIAMFLTHRGKADGARDDRA